MKFLFQLITIVPLSFCLSASAFANEAKSDSTAKKKQTKISAAKPETKKHRHHDAHVHGGGTLTIAFDGTKGAVEFRVAAESILGFEHKASSKTDKEALSNAIAAFENQISNWINFARDTSCQFSKKEIGQVIEAENPASGTHSDWLAKYELNCQRSPMGTSIQIDFSKYKSIKDLDITVLIDNVQKSEEYKGKAISIQL